jgi:hypothetical protein
MRVKLLSEEVSTPSTLSTPIWKISTRYLKSSPPKQPVSCGLFNL